VRSVRVLGRLSGGREKKKKKKENSNFKCLVEIKVFSRVFSFGDGWVDERERESKKRERVEKSRDQHERERVTWDRLE